MALLATCDFAFKACMQIWPWCCGCAGTFERSHVAANEELPVGGIRTTFTTTSPTPSLGALAPALDMVALNLRIMSQISAVSEADGCLHVELLSVLIQKLAARAEALTQVVSSNLLKMTQTCTEYFCKSFGPGSQTEELELGTELVLSVRSNPACCKAAKNACGRQQVEHNIDSDASIHCTGRLHCAADFHETNLIAQTSARRSCNARRSLVDTQRLQCLHVRPSSQVLRANRACRDSHAQVLLQQSARIRSLLRVHCM